MLERRGNMIGDLAIMVGHHFSIDHRWLHRMERDGLGDRHDRKSPGGPRLLTPEWEGAVGEDLNRPPSESRFGRGSWNSRLLAR